MLIDLDLIQDLVDAGFRLRIAPTYYKTVQVQMFNESNDVKAEHEDIHMAVIQVINEMDRAISEDMAETTEQFREASERLIVFRKVVGE